MRKQVLTLTLNQPRKVLSSFHIKKVGIICSFDIYLFGKGAELVSRLPTIHHCLCSTGW